MAEDVVEPKKEEDTKEIDKAADGLMKKTNRLQQMLITRESWNVFQKMMVKPKEVNTALTINEKGEVVKTIPKEAPISKGNLRKGTLRNKKCSCNSGKKFKRCCGRKNS